MAKLTDEQAKLFLDKNFGAVATIREDGTPRGRHAACDARMGRLRRRARPLQHRGSTREVEAPEARSTRDRGVHSEENPYEYVTVTGTADLDENEKEANRHIDKMSLKYTGIPNYQGHTPGERRVIVRITPERVFPK